MAVALTGEAASDGSVAFGVNLNFSLDPRHGITLSRRPLAQAGAVHALVYRDLNDNGVHDPDEPFEKGALITTGTQQADRPTDAGGSVTVGGLTRLHAGRGRPRRDQPRRSRCSSPRRRCRSWCRGPGVPADVQIGLVGGGDIEGAIVKSGGLGFEGLDLELVDAAGKVVGDGANRFRRLLPVRACGVRHLHGADQRRMSAAAAKVVAELGVRVEVTADKTVVRLGAIQARPRRCSRQPPQRRDTLKRDC